MKNAPEELIHSIVMEIKQAEHERAAFPKTHPDIKFKSMAFSGLFTFF